MTPVACLLCSVEQQLRSDLIHEQRMLNLYAVYLAGRMDGIGGPDARFRLCAYCESRMVIARSELEEVLEPSPHRPSVQSLPGRRGPVGSAWG